MTNKRQLKKFIHNLADSVVKAVLPAAVFGDFISEERCDQMIVDLSVAQQKALAHVSVAFDKAPRDFASMAEYRKARTEYFHKAYLKAEKEYTDEVNAILGEINDAMKDKK